MLELVLSEHAIAHSSRRAVFVLNVRLISSLDCHDAISHTHSDTIRADVSSAKDRLPVELVIQEMHVTLIFIWSNSRHVTDAKPARRAPITLHARTSYSKAISWILRHRWSGQSRLLHGHWLNGLTSQITKHRCICRRPINSWVRIHWLLLLHLLRWLCLILRLLCILLRCRNPHR